MNLKTKTKKFLKDRKAEINFQFPGSSATKTKKLGGNTHREYNNGCHIDESFHMLWPNGKKHCW